VNSAGDIIGHSHVVIQALTSLGQTTPAEPATFAFFKGVNEAAVNGVLSVPVTAGLPKGFYKLSTINSAANHQPVLVAIAQHGSLNDAVYVSIQCGVSVSQTLIGSQFTVTDNGATTGGAGGASGGAAASPAATGKGQGGAKTASSVIAVSTSTTASAKTTAAAPAATTTVGNASTGGANFGQCSAPQIKFAFGLDGRKEAAFQAVDQSAFPASPHPSSYPPVGVQTAN
jgi:hypothetical protein